MGSDNNPFGALDKMLLSSPPTEKKPQQKKRKQQPKRVKPKRAAKKEKSAIDQSGRPVKSTSPVNQSTRSVSSSSLPDQSSQPTESINPKDLSTEQLLGEVVKRPLAFYIPLAINDRIDEAVRYFQSKYHGKIDRSAVVSAILGNPKLWEPASLDEVSGAVLGQLKNRLNDRLSNRLNESIR